MSVQRAFMSALVATSLSVGIPANATVSDDTNAFQRLPRLPKLPKLPSRRSVATSQAERPTRPSASNRELQNEYRREVDMLAYQINSNWASQEDNVRVEKAVAEYRERVNYVAGGRFNSLPDANRNAVAQRLTYHYDMLAKTADKEIAWAEQKISNIGVADSAYNEMLILDAALYGAVTLYPEQPDYADAKAKVETVLTKFGSRAGASTQKDAVIMAKARMVKMPPPTERNKAVEDMFRRAWATGGIPYTVKKIHIRGGWGVKRNEYGRAIGRTRDAAIAAKDPASDRCNLYSFTMIVETGGSPRRSSHSTKRMACENIPK